MAQGFFQQELGELKEKLEVSSGKIARLEEALVWRSSFGGGDADGKGDGPGETGEQVIMGGLADLARVKWALLPFDCQTYLRIITNPKEEYTAAKIKVESAFLVSVSRTKTIKPLSAAQEKWLSDIECKA